MNNIIGILPCAGTASRLFCLPKFMLPMKDNNASLMSNWIKMLEEKCDKIIIGTSITNSLFIEHIVKTQLQQLQDKIIIKIVGNTETMNETIIKCLDGEKYNIAIMCMPDTYCSNISHSLIDNVVSNNETSVGAYVWNIRDTQLGKIGQCECDINRNIITSIVDKDINCSYKYGWGCIVFKPEFEKYIHKEDLHIGYSMKHSIESNENVSFEIMNGMFFDCGTIQGYSEYINYMVKPKPLHIRGTIIILAVYINNDEQNYNTLINCLIQLRNIYKNNIIVAVDNNSLNNKWKKIANDLNMYILENNSVIHRFEMGAYKLALENFRADKYIFIQGTVYINTKLDLSKLNINQPNAIAFSLLHGLNWNNNGLQLINTLLKSINMNDYNDEPLVLCNNFCCNNLFIDDMLNSGLFDLPSNTKNHSCAFERILGYYFINKLNKIETLNNDSFNKIYLGQDPWF
jgi:2-C-methyl-D-erythritol 4-phosphate cytidylyltransferase